MKEKTSDSSLELMEERIEPTEGERAQ